jgi:hypothetical protein
MIIKNTTMKTAFRFFAKILPLFNCIFLFPPAAQAQWSAPVIISTGAVSAILNESMGPCIGASGDTLHVVYADRFNSAKGAIYYTQSVDTGLTWTTPIAISDTAGNAFNPAIAVNGSNIHVVWRKIDPLNNAHRTSYYKHSLDGGFTWGPLVLLDDSIADWPAVAVSGDTVYVANDIKTADSPYNTEIFFLRSFDNGFTWSTHQQITFIVGRSEDEAITASGPYVHMSWNDNRNGYMQIFYKESADHGATWGPDVLVNSEHSYSTAVCADGAYVDITSAGAPSGHYQIHLNQSADNGLNWGPDNDLTGDTANTYYYPYMVRDSADLHVTCLKIGVGAEYLHSADGGANWDTPYLFFTGNTGITAFPAYTGCAVHIVYCNNTDHQIYYLRNPTGNAGHCNEIITGENTLLEPENQIGIFPNPFSNETTMKIFSSEKIENACLAGRQAELIIFDVLGNEVFEISGINSNEIRVDFSNLADGIYIARIKTKTGIISQKLIKQ